LQRNDFCHRAAQHRQRGHAVARLDVRVGWRAANHARDLRARGIGHLRLVLVEPSRLQSIGERHTRCVHVDENLAVTDWLIDLDDPRRLRAI
jgi:hypothetical protein